MPLDNQNPNHLNQLYNAVILNDAATVLHMLEVFYATKEVIWCGKTNFFNNAFLESASVDGKYHLSSYDVTYGNDDFSSESSYFTISQSVSSNSLTSLDTDASTTQEAAPMCQAMTSDLSQSSQYNLKFYILRNFNPTNLCIFLTQFPNASKIIEVISQHYNIDINFIDHLSGYCALVLAISYGHYEIVRTLFSIFKTTISLQVTDKDNKTVLTIAKENGYNNIVTLLIDEYLSRNMEYDSHKNSKNLKNNLNNSHIDEINLTIYQDTAISDSYTNLFNSYLTCCQNYYSYKNLFSTADNTDILFYLIHKISNNSCDIKKFIKLCYCLKAIHDNSGFDPKLEEDLFDFFDNQSKTINGTVNINKKDACGKTLCKYAIDNNNKYLLFELCKLFVDELDINQSIDDTTGNTLLISFALDNDIESIDFICQLFNDIDCNVQNNIGQTACACAILNNNFVLFRHLTQVSFPNVVDIHIFDKNMLSPLLYAISAGEYNIIVYLYKMFNWNFGLMTTAKKEHYKKIFSLAINCDFRIKIFLLEYFKQFIDINYVDSNGYTCLMHTILSGQKEILEIILRTFNKTINFNRLLHMIVKYHNNSSGIEYSENIIGPSEKNSLEIMLNFLIEY